MQQISGVSGAAPLWQQILLHLHEGNEPEAFPALTDWVKRPICSISGYKPTDECPTVVEEYLLPDDLGEYERSADTPFQLPPVYDEWLASQPGSEWAAGELRILTPRDDAYFVVAEGATSEPTDGPRLAFKIVAPSGQSVAWRLNGELLATTTEREFFWAMQEGEWVLEVKSEALGDHVQFQVRSPDDSPNKRGFSVSTPENN